jgi:ribosome recycling factor
MRSIKSGRASNDIFDELEVNAYGEMHPFGDLTQTIVRGNQVLSVKVFDESVKDEVLKSLTRCDMDIEVSMEGKDIKVKMGLGKKEHQQ